MTEEKRQDKTGPWIQAQVTARVCYGNVYKKTHGAKPTFFSSSSSSFHFAPSSLPTSPVKSELTLSPGFRTVEKRAKRRTEARVRILCLDPLSPVLAEEHVRRERTLGCLWVLFTSTPPGGFLGFLRSLACLRGVQNEHGQVKTRTRRVGWRGCD